MPYKIFICYRRADKELARGIESKLTGEFGSNSVFLDVEKISGGKKWKNSVTKAIKANPIVITLITTKWNSRRGGKPKLMDPNDHVRFELETALGKGLTVVPVLYGRATLPKEEQLPPTLHPILGFQTIPFSIERWNYDSDTLVNALKDLLGESQQSVSLQASTLGSKTLASGLNYPGNYTRSMFTVSPDQQKRIEENLKKEEERLKLVRATSPKFYARPDFWIAGVITFLLSIASIYGAEYLIYAVAGTLDIPQISMTAGVGLASLWSLVWIGLGAASYSDDPALGSGVFYTRGIFGGWVLGYDDFEPIGYWAAFPLSTGILWILSHIIAMLTMQYFQWNFSVVFWIIIGLYSLPVIIQYVLIAIDEWVLF